MIKDYAEAHVANYFLVLLGIVLFGVAVNLIPSISTWIASVERRAAEASMASTPKPTPRSTPKMREAVSKESEPLLAARKHKKYLEQATGPDLYRANTMKAEFAKKRQKK
jgi:hypothetical protein